MAVDRTQGVLRDGVHQILQVTDSRSGTLQRSPFRQLDNGRERLAPGSRHKLRTDKGNQQPRYHQQHQSAADHHPTAAEQRAQQGAVTGNPDAVSPPCTTTSTTILPSGNPVIQHRDHQDRHKQRRYQRERHRPGLIFKQFSRSAMQIDNRQKDDDRRQRRGNDRTGHFGGSRYGSFTYRHPFLLITENTFDHYDRIIHQHTGSERQSTKRHDIEGKMIKEHQVESCDNGNRDSQADNQRCPQTAKEDEQDHHRKDNP